ncbi:MAG: CotH kinase family protein [Bacteroidales bacterium]|nr:CotH kinase family protein [Bacteroidales bacterium]
MAPKLWLSAAVSLLLVAACGREEIIEKTTPRLWSISVPETTLVLSPEDTATVRFTVRDHDFVFDYNLQSPGCQVEIKSQDGATPSQFILSSVKKGEKLGEYVATLEDNGTVGIYEETVCVCISQENAKTGNISVTSSPYFTVKSEATEETGGVIIKTGLPVVYVNTQGGVGVYSKTEYVPASMSIKGTKKLPGLESVTCSIRGRGNTTWTWPKKPYLVKLEERTSVLGFPKHKRWVLLANFMDRTLMRNLVSMKVSSMMTNLAWTPHCQPVELVLNGKHVGSYLLIEQVRVDKNRVNITEMTQDDNGATTVTGGYLLELDFHYDNEFQWKDHNIPFAVKYPDPEDLTSYQKNYIKSYIAEVSNVIYGSNYADPQNGYAKYLDVDSYIDYWIVYEVMTNHELGNPGSVMFHKDRGGKLTAGPCWDFDWGVLSFYTSNGANGLINKHAIWYDRLFQDDTFKAKVKARFNELLPQLETIPDYMEECRALLSESAKLNFAMWNPAEDASQNGGKIINGDENLSFDAAVDRLKKNYNTHLGVIKSKL